MMKGVMMSAILSVADTATTGENTSAASAQNADTQPVKSLVMAGKQAYSSPYTVTVKKIAPIAGTDQVRVMLFVTGDDSPGHDFAETGNQVVAAFFDAAIRANGGGAAKATVRKIEAVEGGDDDSDDSDDDSDTDALSGLVADAEPPTSPTSPQPTSSVTPEAPAGNVPTLPVPPPVAGNKPTTSPSSPIQQPGTTLGDAAGEEAANDGPSEHEKPPYTP